MIPSVCPIDYCYTISVANRIESNEMIKEMIKESGVKAIVFSKNKQHLAEVNMGDCRRPQVLLCTIVD